VCVDFVAIQWLSNLRVRPFSCKLVKVYFIHCVYTR